MPSAIRVRFTIRILLFVTAATGVALFVLYVRPTQVANRFVAAVVRHDYQIAKSFLGSAEDVSFDDEGGTVHAVHAEVLPREWEDFWRCRRRVIVRFAHQQEEDGRRVDWVSDTDLVARFDGSVVAEPLFDFSQLKCGLVEIPSYSEPPRIPDYTLVP